MRDKIDARAPQYFAHSENASGYAELLRVHLEGVANMAEQFASCYGCGEEARFAGLPHDIGKYGCALANEGGGRVVLVVTNKRPHKVVGTQAFLQFEDVEGRKGDGIVVPAS